MSLLTILNQISSVSGTNDKLDILRDNKDNAFLKEVFYYALNPHINFYLQEKSIPEIGVPFEDIILDEQSLDSYLSPFYNREVTGNAAKELLATHFNYLSNDNAEVLKRIILKDLKCGISGKGANKVWKGLIPEFGYMRCSGPNKEGNIKYPAIVQTKADGAFCNVIIRNGVVEFLTRNGSPFLLPTLADVFLTLGADNMVFTGELTVLDGEGKVLNRKTGNGMVNKLIKRDQTTESHEEKLRNANPKQRVRLNEKFEKHVGDLEMIEDHTIIDLWDAIPLDLWEGGLDKTPYVKRMENLIFHMFTNDRKKINIIETKRVNNKIQAQDFYGRMIAEGKEGAVLKNTDMPWKDGTSTQQVKLKQVLDCDLEIVGWYKGKQESEFKHGIGGFNLRSSCGLLEVNVGSGLTRAERGLELANPDNVAEGLQPIAGFDFDQYTGKIAAIQFNECGQAKGKEIWSLFLPILVEVREDKTEADDLVKIQSQK
jgi:hypothetical protein